MNYEVSKEDWKRETKSWGLWAQREPAIHTRYAKAKTGSREGVCPEYVMGRTGPAYYRRLQILHDREVCAGSTSAKRSAKCVTKSRKEVYCQRPGKAGCNKIVKIYGIFSTFTTLEAYSRRLDMMVIKQKGGECSAMDFSLPGFKATPMEI